MPDRPRPDPNQGVFETLLVLDGRPIELDAHLARLEASLGELFPDRPANLGEDVPGLRHPYGPLSPGTSALCVQAGDALHSMRVTVAPNAGKGLDTQTSLREVEPKLVFDPAPISLHSLTLSGGLGAHKWADRLLLEEAQSKLPANALPLIVDSDGTALEASRANVFAVRDGALLTPPLDGRILPGVTRMRVIELAGALEIEAREVELSSEDLAGSDEVILTGSVRGIETVCSIDGTALAGGGTIASDLGAELRRTWAGAQVG